MGELGAIRRYAYWSARRITDIAADNSIDLDRRWRTTFRTPAFGILPQAEFAEEPRSTPRHEMARKIEVAIGQLAIEDFATPPPVVFAKGCSEVTLAVYARLHRATDGNTEAVIAHTRAEGSNGSHVEICLFGSIDNMVDYVAGPDAKAPLWRASSRKAIDDYIASRGQEAPWPYDDDESAAVETLRTIYNEGMTRRHIYQRMVSAEWFAEVYKDVELDKGRWNLKPGRDLPEQVDRIVIGAPLWVRSNGR